MVINDHTLSDKGKHQALYKTLEREGGLGV